MSALWLSSKDGAATTPVATSTTRTTTRTSDLDLGTLVAVASPLYAPPPPPPPPPVPVVGPPVAPAAAPPPGPPPSNKASRRKSQKGKASWYQIDNGTCAHVNLPKGTLVRVVNLENKKEIVCRVADRGPFLQGRIIDLDLEGFKQLANRSDGVIDVKINW